jgi:hypothetical protein
MTDAPERNADQNAPARPRRGSDRFSKTFIKVVALEQMGHNIGRMAWGESSGGDC